MFSECEGCLLIVSSCVHLNVKVYIHHRCVQFRFRALCNGHIHCNNETYKTFPNFYLGFQTLNITSNNLKASQIDQLFTIIPTSNHKQFNLDESSFHLCPICELTSFLIWLYIGQLFQLYSCTAQMNIILNFIQTSYMHFTRPYPKTYVFQNSSKFPIKLKLLFASTLQINLPFVHLSSKVHSSMFPCLPVTSAISKLSLLPTYHLFQVRSYFCSCCEVYLVITFLSFEPFMMYLFWVFHFHFCNCDMT